VYSVTVGGLAFSSWKFPLEVLYIVMYTYEMPEVSRVRSTKSEDARFNPKLQLPIGKEQIQRKKLDPQYVAGFIDGEGSFSISIGKHKTLRRGFEVRPEFEIELRKDDQEILERILVTIGIGRIYDCSYERYG